jgi:hypothetical protein
MTKETSRSIGEEADGRRWVCTVWREVIRDAAESLNSGKATRAFDQESSSTPAVHGEWSSMMRGDQNFLRNLDAVSCRNGVGQGVEGFEVLYWECVLGF